MRDGIVYQTLADRGGVGSRSAVRRTDSGGLSDSLRQKHDPQRLDAIAVAVVRCPTVDELLRRVSQPTPIGG